MDDMINTFLHRMGFWYLMEDGWIITCHHSSRQPDQYLVERQPHSLLLSPGGLRRGNRLPLTFLLIVMEALSNVKNLPTKAM